MSNYLIIPLAGYGKRFIRAGYKDLKPFLKINKKENMIDVILKNFPSEFKKIFIVRADIQKKYLDVLKKYKNSKIYFIKGHNLGPLFTVYKIKNKIPSLKNIFISYCDIHWIWRRKNFNSLKSNTIFCYKGWHPFTSNNNNYAFCKTVKSNVIQVREKGSFTKNWQKENLSIGLFFYKKSSEMFDAMEKIVKRNIRVNKEFFPSLAYNFIKNKKALDVKNFVHIGKPDYFEIFKKWDNYSKLKNKFKKNIKKTYLADKIIIPAAGLGKRFLKEKIKTPKFLCKASYNNEFMINLIKNFLTQKNTINLITLKKYKFLEKKFKLHILNSLSKGQADTVYKILSDIKYDESLFINSCDNFSLFDVNLYKKLIKKSDILVFITNNFETDNSTSEGTWVKSKKNKIQKIIFKKPKIKKSSRLTGNFYFRSKKIFNKCYFEAINKGYGKEIYIDNLIEEALKMKLKVSCIHDDVYVNMGTPKLLREFNFWDKYFNE